MKKTSILIFVDDGTLAPNTAALNLISLVSRGLSEQGYNVYIERIADEPYRKTYLQKLLSSIYRMESIRSYDIVIYYGLSGITLLFLWILSLAGPALICYVAEWPIAIKTRKGILCLNDKLYCALVFRISRGVIVISRYLENKYIEMKNFHETVLRVPVLCDPFSFNNETKLKDVSCCHIISYCAHLSAYLDDARLVIESVSKIGLKVRLKLIGPITHRDRCYLQGFADHACLGESIEFISNISRFELINLYLESSVLIAPISNDEASLARFPSKIVDYMMSGRPIVTSAYGEPSFILEHLNSAYIAKSHTSIAYAEALRTALLDSNAEVVGRRGRSIAIRYLNYKLHAKSITQFFQQFREVS